MAGLNPDIPVAKKSEDKLRRYPLARDIASKINQFKEEASFTIGIEGEWGFGKTVLVNFLLENLKSKEDNLIVEFNAWNFSNQNALIKDFFNSIAEGLGQGEESKIQKIRKQFKNYELKLLKNDETVQTERGSILKRIIIAPKLAFKSLFEKSQEPSQKNNISLNELRREIDKLISNKLIISHRGSSTHKKRMIIVIDDIDRLDSDETKLILRLVKLNANFPRTIFILVYDRGRVGARLTESGINGEEYLKKFIQLPFAMPDPTSGDLRIILEDAIIDQLKLNNFDDKKLKGDERWKGFMNPEFRELFPTIRDIRRYTNSLSLNLQIIDKDAVDPIDFVGIEAIRIFAPNVYRAMAGEKLVFTGRDSKKLRNCVEEIIQTAPDGLKEIVKGIIRNLFPEVEKLYTSRSISTQGGDTQEMIEDSALRICTTSTFDKYFPPSVIAEETMKKILSPLKELEKMRVEFEKQQGKIEIKLNKRQKEAKIELREQLKEQIQKLEKQLKEMEIELKKQLEEALKMGRLRLLIERLIDSLEDLSKRELIDLLTIIFKYVKSKTPENLTPIWRKESEEQKVYEQVRELGEYALEVIKLDKKGQTTRNEIVKGIMESKLVNDISFPVKLINYLDKRFEGHNTENRRRKAAGEEEIPADTALTSELNLKELSDPCIEKIEESAGNDTLHKNIWFGEVLSYWEVRQKEDMKRYVKKLLTMDDGPLRFIEGMIVLKTSFKDGYLTSVKVIDRDRVAKLTDIGELDRLVGELDEENEAVKLYKKTLKNS